MKEDALDLAKGRVYKLEKQLKDEMKKSLKESQAKEFYLTKGGQWKSKFMELSDRVGRRACKVRLLLFSWKNLKLHMVVLTPCKPLAPSKANQADSDKQDCQCRKVFYHVGYALHLCSSKLHLFLATGVNKLPFPPTLVGEKLLKISH